MTARLRTNFVAGVDAKDHGVAGDAGADGDGVVDLEHGRGGDDVGDGLADGGHVFAGHVVVADGVVRPGDGAADELHLDHAGADGADEAEGVLLAGETEGDDQDDGGRADDHAEHGEEEADLGGAEAVKGEAGDLGEDHGGARGGEGRVEGGAARGDGRIGRWGRWWLP